MSLIKSPLRKWPRTADPKSSVPAEPIVLTVHEDESRCGDIQCDGTVHVSGHVEGDIHALRIVVSEIGSVDGAIAARTVHADGTVNGPIVGGRVTLGPTARIKGNIAYDALNIATGASVSGFFQDRARRDIAPFRALRLDIVPPLPFKKARAACRKSRRIAAPAIPEPKAESRPVSMKAVWDAYEKT